MSVALPDGFVDTGEICNIEQSANVKVLMRAANIPESPGSRPTAEIGPWTVSGTHNPRVSGACSPNEALYAELRLDGPLTSDFLLQELFEICNLQAQWPSPTMSEQQAYSFTAGPFRLGYRVVDISTDGASLKLWKDWRVEFAWFSDVDTVVNTNLGSRSVQYYWITGTATPPAADAVQNEGQIIGCLSFSANPVEGIIDHDNYPWTTPPGRLFTSYNADSPQVIISDLEVNGSSVNTSGLPGGGGSGVTVTENTGSSGGTACPPWDYSKDIHVTKFGQGEAPVTLDVTDEGTQKQMYSWDNDPPQFDGLFRVDIDADSALGHNPPLPNWDLKVCMRANPPIGAHDVARNYKPVDVTFAKERSILRSGNLWVPSSGDIVVSGGQFTVNATGSNVRRTLAQKWRNWVDKGHASFGIDYYEVTKADYFGADAAQDIWGAGSYGYIRVDINTPSAQQLNLRIEGVYLNVTDPHTTGSDRIDGFAVEEVPFTYEYQVPVSSGANVVDVDVCFPTNVTGPVFLDRVDVIQLYGFSTGVYTLNSLKWYSKGPVYLKLDYGPPHKRSETLPSGVSPEFSCLWEVVDGVPVRLNHPDTILKGGTPGDGEVYTYGGAMRFVNVITGAATGTILDTIYSCSDFCTLWNRIEGWTVEYDVVVANANLQDNYGTHLGYEPAQVIAPLCPKPTITPDVVTQPICNIPCREIQITNCYTYVVGANHPIYGAIEALAKQGSVRGGGSVGIEAFRTDTSAAVSSGVTDSEGFIRLVVPANADINFDLRQN